MSLNRRDFSASLVGVAGMAGMSWTGAQAQGAPVEGRDYLKVSPPAPVQAPAGKIEVVEHFWYGCPHCSALEPALESWLKKLPSDVAFRRIPAGFTPMHEYHQKLYFALESLGLVETLHRKVFAAMHVERKRLDKDADVLAFLTAAGADGPKVLEAMKSFSVSGKCRQASQTGQAYKIDGVPALGIAGRYLTSASMTGNVDRSFAVADALIAQSRKG